MLLKAATHYASAAIAVLPVHICIPPMRLQGLAKHESLCQKFKVYARHLLLSHRYSILRPASKDAELVEHSFQGHKPPFRPAS